MSAREGTTSETPLAEVLRDTCFDRKDGIVTVRASGRSDELYFDRGEIFYAKTNAPEERLDRLLVKWGLVAQHDVAALVERAGPDVRGALVREGVFPDAAAFDDFMGKVLRERMASVFAVAEAAWSLEERDVRALRSVPFTTSTPDVILEGVRRMPRAEELLRPLVEDDSAPAPVARPAVPLESLRLGPSEGYVFSLVDGVTPVSTILSTSPIARGDTLRLLYGLLVIDVLSHPACEGYRFTIAHFARRREEEGSREGAERDRIEAEYRRARGVDLFHLIPDSESMGLADRRAALKAWQAQWAATNFSSRIRKELRDELTYLAGRAGEALLALMDEERRRVGEHGAEAVEGGGTEFRRMELSKSQAQSRQDELETQARQFHDHARVALGKKDFHSAVQYLREAIRLHETSDDQELLGDALAANPHWRRKAEEAYTRAMELDRFRPEVPFKLGNLYARSGLVTKAREAFEQALTVQPDHEASKQALRELKKR